MDPTFLIGSGLVLLGGFVWLFCAVPRLPDGPEVRPRADHLGDPRGHLRAVRPVRPVPAAEGHVETHHDKKADAQAALYEVPKKKH